jgi:hypothetical protein
MRLQLKVSKATNKQTIKQTNNKQATVKTTTQWQTYENFLERRW